MKKVRVASSRFTENWKFLEILLISDSDLKEESEVRVMKRGKNINIFLNLSIFLIFILLINLNFISASQKYTLKVTDEHPFFVVDSNNNVINVNDKEVGIRSESETEGYSENEIYKNNKINKINKLNGIWETASELKVGDSFLTADGKKAKVISLKNVDEGVEVYNLESAIYNDFVVSGDVVVHNSNTPEEIFHFELPKNTLNNIKRKTGKTGVGFKITEPSSELKKMIIEEYEKTLGKIDESSSLQDLVNEVHNFDWAMKEKMPYLGKPNFKSTGMSFNLRQSCRDIYNYFLYLAKNEPTLMQIGDCKMLDCSAQAATIRQSLGGKGSGWELYYDRMTGIEDVIEFRHVFLAKKIKIADGEFMIMINPAATESGVVLIIPQFNSLPFERINLSP